MDVKMYLKQYQFATTEVEACYEQIAALRDEATRMSAELSDMPKGGSGRDIDDIVAEMVDLRAELIDRITRANKLRKEVCDVIYSLEDDRLIWLLHLRYVDGYKWETIARRMGYDLRYLHKLHGRALKDIKRHYGHVL
ncbi:hypothetical protein ACKQTC_08465 [Peptococcus simiae]|uniref:DUF1492 domain-containing protein n=1 Tax=Peptococcus simiae TaxID=1643805 RepID=A0ABW9H0L5_9FIRM